MMAAGTYPLDAAVSADFPSWAHQQWAQYAGYTGKSVHGVEYSFYHDLLTRQLGSSRESLTYTGESGTEKFSCDVLDIQVETLCRSWLQQGVSTGSSIVLAGFSGVGRHATLLAALRLGLVISLLDASGPYRLNHEVEMLAPDHVFLDYGIRDWLGAGQASRLLHNARGDTSLEVASHAYPSGVPVLRLLSSFAEGCSGIMTLTSGQLFTALVRDGHLLMGLKPDHRVICMGDAAVMLSPLLELAILFCGARLHSIAPQCSAAHAGLLFDEPVDWVFISESSRSMLMREPWQGKLPGRVAHWVIPMTEFNHASQWLNFIARVTAGSGSVCHIVAGEAALGGMLAVSADFGQASAVQVPIAVTPVPGLDGYAGNIAQPGQATQSDLGRLCLRQGEDFFPTPFLMRIGESGEWAFLGLFPPGRQGAVYPARLVEKLLARPGAWHVCLEVPVSSGENRAQHMLLAFCDDRSVEVLRELIVSQLGPAASPDRIRRYALVPRLDGSGHVNADWCMQLFLAGELERRCSHPLYASLSQLKKELLMKQPT